MHDAAKIRAVRERRKLTQADAAAKAGMSQQQWANVEGGHTGGKRGISLATLDKIANALGVKARDLLK